MSIKNNTQSNRLKKDFKNLFKSQIQKGSIKYNKMKSRKEQI